MANAPTLTLVGWDDVLCRPIYAVAAKPPPKRTGKKKATLQLSNRQETSDGHSLAFGQLPTPGEFGHRKPAEKSDRGGREKLVTKRRRRERAIRPQPKCERDSPLSDVTCDLPEPRIEVESCPSSQKDGSIQSDVSLKDAEGITASSNATGSDVSDKRFNPNEAKASDSITRARDECTDKAAAMGDDVSTAETENCFDAFVDSLEKDSSDILVPTSKAQDEESTIHSRQSDVDSISADPHTELDACIHSSIGSPPDSGGTTDKLGFDTTKIHEAEATVQSSDHNDLESVGMKPATADFPSDNTIFAPDMFERDSADIDKPTGSLEDYGCVGTRTNSDYDWDPTMKCPPVNMNVSCELDELDTPATGNNKPSYTSEGNGNVVEIPTASDDNRSTERPNICLSKALATPLKGTWVNNSTAYTGAVDSNLLNTDISNVDMKDLNDDIANSGIKSLALESPMLLDSSRKNAEPSDVESIDISLFHDLEPGEKSPTDKRRSYGTSNKPNWSIKSSTELKSEPTAGQRQLIGWDDVKCRPIYQVSQPKQCSQMVEADIENTCEVNEQTKLQKSSHKKRVYASTFKMSGIFKAARHNMDIESPISLHDPNARRVTMESAAQSIKGSISITSVAPENQIENSELDFSSEKYSHEYSETSEDVNGEKEENSSQNESRFQPTSKSTLESARAFFRYLDSNHNLTISNGQDSPASNTKLDVIRTTRRIEHCDQLREEYAEYCNMADSTGVDPITIDEFARHWNVYFTERGVIRDGLLDED